MKRARAPWRRGRQPSGQAVVELALGAVVLVTVLLVGIHLAEVAILSLKVQEAQTYAVWQTTQRRVQTREASGASTLSPFNATLDNTSGEEARAQQRYRDFNGLDSVNSGPGISLALTRGRGMDVDCERDGRLHFRPSDTPQNANIYLDEGALHCSAEARLDAIRIPKAFMNKADGSWFRAEQLQRDSIRVCGMGLPRNGSCQGRVLAILTNDWGLAGDETGECRLRGCTNQKYRGMVQRMWVGDLGARSIAFATAFSGAAPASGADFWFSYSGIESGHAEFTGGEGAGTYLTGGPAVPGGMVYQSKTDGKCFLGRRCP
ncbi:MAG: hypothetical protein IT380_00490 [Myxococcales bacterium]|nr:hypothetical protein [Myxococcales bacterium]